MARFASLGGGGASSYAAAGKAAAGSAARMFDIQRKTGPDYAGLSKVAMAAQTAENIGAMQAEASLAKDGINATLTAQMGKLRGEYIVDKGKQEDKQRMAGILPAVGKIVGTAFKKDPKRPPPLLAVEPVKPESVEYPEYEGERPQAPEKPSFLPIDQGTPESSNTNSSADSTVQSADVPVSSSLKLTSNDYDELAFAVTSEAQPGTMDEYAVAASKGQKMLHNRVPNEDPMFSDRGNFFHYSWQ
jgi:hypothetical protein